MRRSSSARTLPLALLFIALLMASACAGADVEGEANPARAGDAAAADGDRAAGRGAGDREASGAQDREAGSGAGEEGPAPAQSDPAGLPGDVLDACRSLADEAPALSDEDREQVVRDCEGAVTGDEETIRKATEAACDGAAVAGAPALLKGQAAEACKSLLP